MKHMPKIFTSEKQKIGEAGEKIAEKFLMKQGFTILERNYTKKWGELDIVAEKSGKLYFIEVKSVSNETCYRAEENMHPWKMQRLSRIIQTYLLSKKVPEEKEWQVDLLVVSLNSTTGASDVKVVSDIIL